MSLIDYIRRILQGNKQNAQIYATTLKKKYGTKEQLEIGLYDNKTPITNNKITININNKDYERTTDNQGIARLNINLPVGSYTAKIRFHNENYNEVTAYADVIVATDTYIDGINLTKNEGDPEQYQCAVYRQDNHERVAGPVNLTINGKTYTRNADNTGLYKLNINLNQGTYTLKAEYQGTATFNPSSTTNTIKVNPKPEPPKPEPQKSRSEKILDEFEKYFGRCEYIDEALEKIQGNGYAFYFSDGYNMYETIRRMANYEGANCFDSSEVFYHLAKGMNTKYGRNYKVQYLDVWCPVSGYDHVRLRLDTGDGWFYRDPACVLDGGDITSNWCGTSNNILEVNPSWIYDGD